MLSTQDKTRIDDTRIASVRPLMTPALLEERLPATPDHLALVEQSRRAISQVLHGQELFTQASGAPKDGNEADPWTPFCAGEVHSMVISRSPVRVAFAVGLPICPNGRT